ncbi:MAG: HDIG domain-containing protein [Synergistaceae bacterium]|nr:HDIG domain-containing protein [Synergistaceae bacterium]
MRDTKSRTRIKNKLISTVGNILHIYSETNVLLPLLLLFASSAIFLQWMLGHNYIVGLPSPQNYIARNELQYIDRTAMERLRELAEQRIVAVVVKDGEKKQEFRVAMQLLRNMTNETTAIPINDFPQELFEALKNMSEPERNMVLSRVEETERVLSAQTSDDADFMSYSERIWLEVDKFDLSPNLANIAYQILHNLMGNNVKIDEQLTQEFKSQQGDSIPIIERRIETGETIVERGQIVTRQIAAILRSQGYIGQVFPLRSLIFCNVLVLLLPFWFNIFIKKELPQRRSLPSFFISLIIGSSWFLEILGQYLSVVGLGSWFLIVASNAALSSNISFSISFAGNFITAFLIIGTSFGNMGLLLFLGIISAISGCYIMKDLVSRRRIMNQVILLGLVIIIFDIILRWVINLPYIWLTSVKLFALGTVLNFTFSLSLPFIEGIMGIVTPMRLREICHPSVPLLKKLQIEIPGTYQHALTISSLAEAVAEDLSLDVNLMKAGAFYHDIGKLRRPHYYVENQLNVGNIQDSLSPPLSALTILAHVKEGLELAAEYRLPLAVRDFIAEHHGTTFMSYFYKKALAEGLNVTEEQFCYPGPKPQSRETALLMLLDSMEAGIRSSGQNISSVTDIERVINRVFEMKLSEGQLDDVNFTFRDLAKIKEVMLKTFQSMYHTRKIKELQDKTQRA